MKKEKKQLRRRFERENGKSSGNDCVWYTDYSVGVPQVRLFRGETQRLL